MESAQDNFKKITNALEKEKLLKDLATARGEILCKGRTDFIFKFKAYTIDGDKIRCQIQADSEKFSQTQEDVIANFFLGGEKYFFQSIATYQENEIYFMMTFDLFQLQRRQNYRVKIPESYKAHFDIADVNGNISKITGVLNDISSGGCRVAFSAAKNGGLPALKIDDLLQASIFIGSRSSIAVTALVKHIKFDSVDKDVCNFGLEFRPLSPQLENKLFAITMDLHRELFSKMI